MRGNAAALGELAIANGTVVRLFPAAKIHLHLQGGHKIEKIQNLWVRQCAVRFAAWLKDLLH